MEILTTLSQEELGKLNQDLEGWLFLAPDLIKGHIARSLEIEDNPFKIIKCECGHILICKLELLNQALKSQEQICSCSKYTYHITNNICKQNIFNEQLDNLLELERKEFNSQNFQETALGIIPPAYGNGDILNFNLDILLWAINTNSGRWKKKNDFIDNFCIFIRNIIVKCQNNYPQELDNLVKFWEQQYQEIILHKMDNAQMRLETTITDVKYYSIRKIEIQQTIDSYRDYFENKEFLEILYNLLKISNNIKFSEKPFEGEYTTFSNGTKAKCEKVTTYYTKLKELNIPEISQAIELSYNNQLRNETGAHSNYRIDEENEMIIILNNPNIKFTFQEIEQYLYYIINFQRSIRRELSALSFFTLREQLPVIKEKVNNIQEEIRKNYLANKNIQIKPSDSMGEYKSNLPTYGIAHINFTFDEIPTICIYQYWSHAFLDSKIESFAKIVFLNLSSHTKGKFLKIGFTPVLYSGEFVIEHTPAIENFIKKLIKHKQFKLVREIIAPNHPFFAILGYPFMINGKQMFHIMRETKIIDMPEFSDKYLDFIPKLTWQEKLRWHSKNLLRRYGLA